MGRQRIASSRIRSQEMLVHRTSAHVRAATNGLVGAVLLAAVSAFAALTIWPAHAKTFGVESAVTHIRDKGWDRYAPIVLIVAVVLGAAALAYSIHRARRWRFERLINRVSASVSTADPSMVDPATDHRAVATGLPAPRIQWVEASRGGMPKPRALTSTTNIIGSPRLEIAYLRLFNHEYRHVSFVKGAWREFGSVNMLRSAVSMTSKEARHARRLGPESLFVTTRQQLESELAAVGNAPRFRAQRVEAGPTRVRVWDRYGAYPMRSILCANATWRAAVDHLLDTADIVVLDLSGYTDRRAGTRYELQRVLDRVPAERLIFLADPKSKNRILEEAIADAWGRMTVDSPNAAHPEVPLWIARVDRLVTTVDHEKNTTTVELVTSRKETRRLMTAVQERLRNARAIAPEPSRAARDSWTDDIDPWQVYGLSKSQPTLSDGGTGPAPAVASTEATAIDQPTTDLRYPAAPRRRRPVPVAAAVAAFALAAGAGAILLVRAGDDPDEPSDASTNGTVPGSSGSCPDGYRAYDRSYPIRLCHTGRAVALIQQGVGAPEIDGYFGPDTRQSVREFQEHTGGLEVDGLVGPQTWAALFPNGAPGTDTDRDGTVEPWETS